MNQILNSKTFNPDLITYAEPKTNVHGGKSVYLNYDKKPLTFQTPKMSIPFGLSKYTPPAGGESKYSLDLSFTGMTDNDDVKQFHDKMAALDSKLMADGMKNAMPWFKKKSATLDVIKELYTPLIKVSKDKETGEPNNKFPPLFKVKMPFIDDKFTCEVYNSSKERVDATPTLLKFATVQVIMKCTGIWFAGGKFGIAWKAHQIKVTPPTGLNGYSFADDSDEGGSTVVDHEQDHVASVSAEPAKPKVNMVADSDDDDDDDEDDEEVAPPPKKIVGKK